MRKKFLCFCLSAALAAASVRLPVYAVEWVGKNAVEPGISEGMESGNGSDFTEIPEGGDGSEGPEGTETGDEPEGAEGIETGDGPEGIVGIETEEGPEDAEEGNVPDLSDGTGEENIPDSADNAEPGEDSDISGDMGSGADFSDGTEEFFSEDSMEDFFLSRETAEKLTGETEKEQELVEEIQSGEVLAMAYLPENAGLSGSELSMEAASARLASDRYKIYVSPKVANCDEVWTSSSALHARLRYIEYVDSEGNVKRSPLYCMKASKKGIDYSDPEGDYIKKAAVKFLKNSTLKKILYFGYGGPGSICDEYDPTCSHADWKKWQNRYVFTHQALSKVYANDVNGATDAQIKHVGLNRFIDKIKSLSIPNRKAVKIWTTDASGNSVTLNPANVNLQLYRTKPGTGMDWLDGSFQNGFQMSRMCAVIDEGSKKNNGISVTCTASDNWQMHYWTSLADAQSNPAKPKVLGKGKSVTLKHGYRFRFVFPKSISAMRTMTWQMTLRPVDFLIVDGNVQTGGSGFQDFGAYVFQGEKGKVQMNFIPQPMGSLLLSKTSFQTGKAVQGAVYELYAAEDLYNGGGLFYLKDHIIAQGTTNGAGQILFESLLPGKYYIKESKAASGYLLDPERHNCIVQSGTAGRMNVQDVPDIKGSVSIEKVARGTDLHLADAEFTLYSWNQAAQKYENGIRLTYDISSKRYVSEIVSYNRVNQGRFRVQETRTPSGYTGSWSADFVLTEPGSNRKFTYKAENYPAEEKRIEIRKIDAETGDALSGAEFTVYAYDSKSQSYLEEGSLLSYNEETQRYISEVLEITDENQGRYKVTESRHPEGYTGSWEQEIDLSNGNAKLQFTVENEPLPRIYGRVRLRKKDAVTGELLSDGEFTVFQWSEENEEYQDTLTENRRLLYDREKQEYVSGNLEITENNQGRFLVKETKNPEGYLGDWEQEAVLKEDGSEITLEAVNEPEKLPVGKITVVKKIREEEITWAHGNPTFSFVVEGTDLRGEKRKYENFVTFVSDSYETDGNGYAELSAAFPNIPVGEYEVYERPVLRYFLKDAKAGTSNVTIRKGSAPGYGIPPKETAYGTVKLDIRNRSASVIFINEKSRYDGYSHNCILKNTIPIGN